MYNYNINLLNIIMLLVLGHCREFQWAFASPVQPNSPIKYLTHSPGVVQNIKYALLKP